MTTPRPFGKYSTLAALGLASGVGAFAFLAFRSGRAATGNRAVPEPMKPVDLDRYLGLWYEFGRYENWFEKGCEGVTALYEKRDDGLIDIVNASRKRGSIAQPRSAKGRARVVQNSGNAKLKVSFFGPFFFGNYWVLDHDEDYAWSIVGEPSGRYLWILTRDATPAENLQQELIERCRSFGYDMTRFRRTLQTSQDASASTNERPGPEAGALS